MSWTLKDHEKIECVKGQKYEIESELIAVENEFLHKNCATRGNGTFIRFFFLDSPLNELPYIHVRIIIIDC